MKRIMIIGMLVLMSFSVNAATVSHSASEVQPGGFASGDYSFDGNVGIGIASPGYDLDIQTDSGNAQLRLKSGGDLAQVLLESTDTSGNSQINFADANDLNIGMLQYYHNDDSMRFTVNNNERMRIDSSGNVGIGTTSPVGQLHLEDSSSAAINSIILSNTDNTADNRVNILFTTNDNSGDSDVGSYIQSRFTSRSTDGVSGVLAFATANDGNNPIEHMRIDEAGDVGIGTTTPGNKLEVRDTTDSSATGLGFFVQNPSIEATAETLRVRGETSADALSITQAGSGNIAQFYDSNANPTVTIDNDGNVGIGTTSPTYELTVNGDIGRDDNSSLKFRSGEVADTKQQAFHFYTVTDGDPAGGFFAIKTKDDYTYLSTGRSYERNYFLRGGNDFSVDVQGALSKGSGSFLIDHPQDPKNKFLSHSFVESPEMRNMYYGQAETGSNKKAAIQLPDWWQALNGENKSEYNYQFTPIGEFCDFYVSSEIEGNKFEVTSDKANCRFSWMVSGIRHDAFAETHRVVVVENKTGDEIGKCRHEEACE